MSQAGALPDLKRKTAVAANSRVATPRRPRRLAQELVLCVPQSTLQRQGTVMGLAVEVLGRLALGFNGFAGG